MSAVPFEPLPTAVDRVLARSRDISVMPQVVFKIMEMTGKEDSSAASLEKAIIVDPGFSARMLTQANSASLALPRKVTSIRDAIAFIGFARVRQLAMTVGVFDLFVGKTDRESLRRRSWWRHSLESAHVGRMVAEVSGTAEPEEVYTAGLLHMIGKTILCRFDTHTYDQVDKRIADGEGDRTAERVLFGCDHGQVAVGAAMKWGFPETLISAMDYMTPPNAQDPAAALRAHVAIADWLTHRFHLKDGEAQPPFPAWALAHSKLEPTKIPELLPRVASVIEGLNQSNA
ncbi:MAG: HDOD domain-containing protein [Armatimonadota bacterium]